MADRSLVLTVEEAAELLGIARGLAYELVRRGELPSIRLGRRLVVPRRRLGPVAWMALGAPVASVEAVTDAVLADDRVIALGGGRWSTAELLSVERQVIDCALAGRGVGMAVVDERLARTVIGLHPTLSAEQTAMVEALVGSGDGMQVVVGVAGAGKTYALGVAHQAWRAAGIRVIGTALSARAAQELADGAGVTSWTIARLTGELADLQRGGLAGGSVLVVDEAAMASSRDLAFLAEHARAAGAKLVLVGDDHQLPAIGAGGLFAAVAERVGAVELVENRRQQQSWERHALHSLRAGDVQVALAAYQAQHRRHHDQDLQGLGARLVADWMAARQQGTRVMMLATRRADVDQLNQLARYQLREAGQLGPDILRVGWREFAVGDEVICGRNDRRLGVINGTRATVLGPADRGGLVVQTADGRSVELSGGYVEAGHLSHSYATTIHKSQGATTERTFILADEHLYQEAGYVALSRGRSRNDLYTPAVSERENEPHGARQRRPDDLLQRGLRRSRAQRPALDTPVLPGRILPELDIERRHLAGRLVDSSVPDYRRDRHRADQVDALINQRTQALGLWAADHPQQDHLEHLGPAPRQPDRRAEWVRAAAEISAYHERYGIAYRPGLAPDDARQRRDHYQVQRTIRVVEPSLDRTRAVDIHRGHDLGLGL